MVAIQVIPELPTRGSYAGALANTAECDAARILFVREIPDV